MSFRAASVGQVMAPNSASPMSGCQRGRAIARAPVARATCGQVVIAGVRFQKQFEIAVQQCVRLVAKLVSLFLLLPFA